MKKMKIALVLAGCLLGGVAAAAPRWDSNGDGTVDAAEKAERHAEMKAKRQEMKKQMLAKFDTNRDGKLDDSERAVMKDSFATEAFTRLDKDGNGSISLAEFKAAKRFGKHHRFGARGSHRGAPNTR